MAALSSYHNIWMMNKAAGKSVVMLLTQGFLPSPCPAGAEGGTERRGKGFVRQCSQFVMRCAVFSACQSFCFYLRVFVVSCFFAPLGLVIVNVSSETRIYSLA